MKMQLKVILTGMFMVTFLVTQAQWEQTSATLITTADKVAIGTTTPDANSLLTLDAGFNDNAKQGVYVKAQAGTNHSGPTLTLDNTATWAYGRSFIRGISRSPSSAIFTDICLYQGQVGINTNYPDATLTVNGLIHAKEVRLDLNITAPDYVFGSDYKLPSLAEVAAYIREHGHLAEVPSAAEMEKNGVNLTEMNMTLLKKVEELTLYMIEQNKKNEEQQKLIQFLIDQNELQRAQLEKLTTPAGQK